MKRCQFTERSVVAVAIATMLAFWPAVSAGSVMVSLNNPGSTTLHEVQVAPGDTFNMDVNLNTNISMFTVSCGLLASASNVFDVTDMTYNSPWQGNITVGGGDPYKGGLGAYLPDPLYFGPGTTTLKTIQIGVDTSAPIGSYTLDIADVTYWPSRAATYFGRGNAGNSFTVSVVPEPVSVAMFLVLVSFLPRRRSR